MQTQGKKQTNNQTKKHKELYHLSLHLSSPLAHTAVRCLATSSLSDLRRDSTGATAIHYSGVNWKDRQQTQVGRVTDSLEKPWVSFSAWSVSHSVNCSAKASIQTVNPAVEVLFCSGVTN